MFYIKTMNHISESGLSKFPADQYQVSETAANPDALLVRSAKLHDYSFESSLKAIARAGAGVNNIPIEQCAEQGIVVFNTPGANANAVKELTIAALLLASRRIPDALAWVQQQKENPDVAKLCEKQKSQFAGPELRGKRLGVVGLGAIGVHVANAAVHLGMEVYGYDPFLSLRSAWKLSSHVHYLKEFSELLQKCDYITLHLPATEKTTHLLNAKTLAETKKGVRIINLARGELVNNQDLVSAVESGQVGCYVADFASPQLLGRPNVVIFPHLGASTPESEANCAQMAAERIVEYLETGNIYNSVNFPDTSMPRSGQVRVCVIHKNIASMLSNISAAISQSGCNIANLINTSRGNFAYTMVDLESEPEHVEQKISEVDGVIRVRLIR